MTTIEVRVTPRSSGNRVKVDETGAIRIYVTAPPVDGQANAAVLELIAKRLGIGKSAVGLLKGESSRDKTLSIEGLTREEVIDRLSDQGRLL